MTRQHRFKLDKLIRDKVAPKILHSYAITAASRTMEQDEYIKHLHKKLIEEAQEVLEAKTKDEVKEELADLLEVMFSLGLVHDISFDDIEKARCQKKITDGGFEGRIYCEYIEMNSDNQYIDYYKSQPHKYPEIKKNDP